MKYNELNAPANKSNNRVGRGISAGQGKTAGRGTKGQGARKSGGVRPGFEGGQMPFYMRIPKLRGFKSHRPKMESIYTGQLEAVSGLVDTAALFKTGLITSPHARVKVLVGGDELTTKKEVKLLAASKNAVRIIQKAGGSFSATPQLPRPAKSVESKKA